MLDILKPGDAKNRILETLVQGTSWKPEQLDSALGIIRRYMLINMGKTNKFHFEVQMITHTIKPEEIAILRHARDGLARNLNIASDLAGMLESSVQDDPELQATYRLFQGWVIRDCILGKPSHNEGLGNTGIHNLLDPDVENVSNWIAGRQELSKVEDRILEALGKGLETPGVSPVEKRSESKSYAVPGEGQLQKFDTFFVKRPKDSLEKDFQNQENIAKQTDMLGRIDMLAIASVKGEHLNYLIVDLEDATGFDRADLTDALALYASSVAEHEGKQVSLANTVTAKGLKVADVLKAVHQQVVKAPRRAFGCNEYLVKKYKDTQSNEILRLISGMNNLATNPNLRNSMNFMQIF
jgi:hypothetical protein